MAAEQAAPHAGRRRKECGVCSDGSCRKCKERAYHRDYNYRRRRAGGRLLFPASREEERIRDLLRELTGQEPPAPTYERHVCYRPDCVECGERELLATQARDRRVAAGGCRCGHDECDCAQWERIYRDKFEDPTYYDRDRGIPRHSPFADI